jgi:hypothetical protein
MTVRDMVGALADACQAIARGRLKGHQDFEATYKIPS